MYKLWYNGSRDGTHTKIGLAETILPNQSPEAICQDVTIPANESCEAEVTPEQVDNGSYDPDGDPITFVLEPHGPYHLGVTEVLLIVSDDKDATDECTATITVVDETPPTITCPDDISVNNDPETCSAVVTFSVTATDNCSEVTVVTEPESGSTFPVGETTVTCTATDEAGNESTSSFKVTVKDNEPPIITTISDPITLWPPNHKYETIDLFQLVTSVTDNCASLAIEDIHITKVTCDEPEDVKGNGDGKTVDDIIINNDCQSVQLRSERQGGGNGRVYTIHLTIEDGNGNIGDATCQVTVPHDKKDTAIDDGVSYEVYSNCGSGMGKLVNRNPELNEIENILPSEFQLFPNFPNPFNPTTEISFALPKESEITLYIYNSSGQIVKELAFGQFAAGTHRLTWNATDDSGNRVASGIYLAVLKAGNFVAQNKLILTK